VGPGPLTAWLATFVGGDAQAAPVKSAKNVTLPVNEAVAETGIDIPVKHWPLVGLLIRMVVTQGALGTVVVGVVGGGGSWATTLRLRQWLAPLGSTTQASMP